MKVRVRFTSQISVLTKTDHTDIDLDQNARLTDLLRVLNTRYGEGFLDLVYTPEQGSVDVWASVIVDGQVVPLPVMPMTDVKLKEGSVVVFMAPVGGG
ncbi:MAG: MoaD/ThiS family protein [Candidatus Bathyarchaeia archaeon]